MAWLSMMTLKHWQWVHDSHSCHFSANLFKNRLENSINIVFPLWSTINFLFAMESPLTFSTLLNIHRSNFIFCWKHHKLSVTLRLFCCAVVFVPLNSLLINLSILCITTLSLLMTDIKTALTDIIKLNWINMVCFVPVISLQVWKCHFIGFQEFTAQILCSSLPKYNIQGLANYNIKCFITRVEN